MLALILLAAGAGVCLWLVTAAVRAIFFPEKPVVLKYEPRQVGDITLDELAKYSGHDPTRPILFAVRGRIFDVTESRGFYGPGGGYAVFAGKEVARAMAKLAISEEECSDKLDDLSPRELEVLKDWEDKFEGKYTVVGRVVPPQLLTPAQLKEHDGSDASKPLLLSIKGTVFDVTSGSDYYGPDGVYPFAGHECARALAKFSTEEQDLNGNLEGCTLSELDALRDWQARFYSKYKIVGRLVEEGSSEGGKEAAKNGKQ